MQPRVSHFLNPQQQVMQWPASQADQAAVLDYLVEKVPPAQNYTESQINEFLKAWHTFGDWSMLRRELVDSKRLHRTPDGSKYWRPQPHVDAYVVGAVVILRRHVLVVRAGGSQLFTAPSGTTQPGEAAAAALVRILGTDLGITVAEADLADFGQYAEKSPLHTNETDHWQAFLLQRWQGEMHHAGHIEELRWLTSEIPAEIEVEPVLRDEIIPLLREQSTID
jgi:ADP-ribose pyrophosphatase YjhB (NUDIX family)